MPCPSFFFSTRHPNAVSNINPGGPGNLLMQQCSDVSEDCSELRAFSL